MAKRGVLTHRKTRRLARCLGGIPLPCAMGVAEALWHATQAHAPTGAIGRLSDESIAEEMWWDGDPADLIAALVDAGFLDRDNEHRLVVHDWYEHADAPTHMAIARRKEFFCSGEAPNLTRLPAADRREAMEFYGSVGATADEEASARQAHAVRTDLDSVRTDCDSVRTASARQAHGKRTAAAFPAPPRPAPPVKEEEQDRGELVGGEVLHPSKAPGSPPPLPSASAPLDPPSPLPGVVIAAPPPAIDGPWPDDPTTDDPVEWLRQHVVFGDARRIRDPALLVQQLRNGWPGLDLVAVFREASDYLRTGAAVTAGYDRHLRRTAQFAAQRQARAPDGTSPRRQATRKPDNYTDADYAADFAAQEARSVTDARA